MRNFTNFREQFIGAALGAQWSVADTSAAGAPTKVMHADGYKLAFSNDNEVQNLCLYHGDIQRFDISKIIEARFRVKQLQAAKNAATSIAVGLASGRNDDPDAISVNAMFRLNANSQVVYLETDDGITDTDDKSTGITLINAYKLLTISFARGLSDIRFFIDGTPVCPNQQFSLASATGNVQPFLQLQKTASTNTDGVQIDLVEIDCRY